MKPRLEGYLPAGLVTSRWQTLAASLFMATVSGTSYAFGVYSEDLRTKLGFSATELAVIASVGGTGLYLGVVSGVLVNQLGPRVVVALGAFFGGLGFSYLYAVMKGLFPASVAAISFMLFVAQFGTSCYSVTATVIAIRNFPHHGRGRVTGLAKMYIGVSSAVLAQISMGFFNGDGTSFLGFLALYMPVIGCISLVQLHFLPPSMIEFSYEHTRGWRTSFQYWYLHGVVIAAFVLLAGYLQHSTELSRSAAVWFTFVMCAMVASVLLLPKLHGHVWVEVEGTSDPAELCPLLSSSARDDQEEEGEGEDEAQQLRDLEASNAGAAAAAAEAAAEVVAAMSPKPFFVDDGEDDDEDAASNVEDGKEDERDLVRSMPKRKARKKGDYHLAGTSETPETRGATVAGFYGRDVGLFEAIQTSRFWLLFFVFTCCAGSGLVVFNNIQSIARSLGQAPSGFFVSVLGLASCAGRAIVGVLTDHVVKRVSRLEVLAGVLGSMACAHGLLVLSSPTLLFPCLVFVGMCYGATFSMMATIMGDIFGPKYIGANYGAVNFAPAVGALIFATGVVSLFYGKGSDCEGPDCFRWTFLTTCLACVCGAGVALHLHRTTDLTHLHTHT